MMRSARCWRAASSTNFITALLSNGRMMDVSIRNCFVERRQGSPPPTPVDTDAVEAVRQRAWQHGALDPPQWRGEVYHAGAASSTSCWASSLQSAATVQAERLDATEVLLSGHTLLAGSTTTPSTAMVFVGRAPHSSAEATLLQVEVPLEADPGVRCSALHPGTMRVTLEKAKGKLVQSSSVAAQEAVQQHTRRAAAFSGMLRRVEGICARHLTHTARWDGLLLRSPAMQERLAKLSAWRHGLDSLRLYVQHRVQEEDTASLLLESAVLNLFAQMALGDGLQLARDVVHGTPLDKVVPYNSHTAAETQPAGTEDRAPLTMDYPYLNALLQTPFESLTAPSGSVKLQAQQLLWPLLQGHEATAQRRAATASLASQLLGLSSGSPNSAGIRLTTTHTILKSAAKHIEADASLMARLSQQIRSTLAEKPSAAVAVASTDPLLLSTVSMMLAELFADVAVLHRSSAVHSCGPQIAAAAEEGCPALDADAQRVTLLGDAFHVFSAQRRHALVEQLGSAMVVYHGLSGKPFPVKAFHGAEAASFTLSGANWTQLLNPFGNNDANSGRSAVTKGSASREAEGGIASLHDGTTHPVELGGASKSTP